MAQVNHSASSSPPHTPNRSRSNSIMRSLMESPKLQHLQQQQQQTPPQGLKRSTTTDGILSRIPSIHHHHHHHHEDSPLSAHTSNQLSDAQLSNTPEHYELKEPIGYGSSAVVFGAIYKPTKRKVAIKVIDLDMFERNQIDELRRETALMALSKHPNVLRVYGSFVSGSKLYIVTPYLSAGSCLDIMNTTYPDGLDEISIATILKQALEGLIYLHKNNHIHRDVKAGNLLMDEYGLVQLADFGVSSSLTQNNEVRKTFVGTPCWMAPEVMEQAGYDYKADIWSFGITSIELATGHAPFSKYSPMKVLMMTLSQDPPTLSRETTKHKFSKMIKEMIDACLQKDPKQRPSAEKLLQHPFFRQAKKKGFLVKSILTRVPTLEKRPHKKVPQKHITFELTDQWDFNTFSADDDNDTTSKKSATPTNNTPTSPLNSNNKKHISFGNVVVSTLPQHGNNKPSPTESPHSPTSPSTRLLSPDIAVPTPQKKSRFVVGENLLDQPNNNPSQSQHSVSSFSDQSIPQLSDDMFTTPSSLSSSSKIDGVGLGISGNTMNQITTLTNGTPGLSQQEVKKGRFSVNQTPQRTLSISTPLLENGPSLSHSSLTLETATAAVIAASAAAAVASSSSASSTATPRSSSTVPTLDSQQDIKSTPISRVDSNDSLRKSRFAILHSPGLPSCDKMAGEMLQCPRKTSANGNCTTTTATATSTAAAATASSKVSRFSVAKEDSKDSVVGLEPGGISRDPNATYHDTPNSSTHYEGRKKGRFQLSGLCDMKDWGSSMESPQSSISSYSPNSSLSRGQSTRMFDPSLVCSHMEHLYRQTEAQKMLLHEMLAGLSLIPGSQVTAPTSCATPKLHENPRPRSDGLNSEISHTMDHLQYLLIVSCREREQLQRENDALKRELDRWRRQTATTTITSINGNNNIINRTPQSNGILQADGSTVVDPLPPSPDTFDYFTPLRPHTTSPTTMTAFEIEKLRSPSSTIHSGINSTLHSHSMGNNNNGQTTMTMAPEDPGHSTSKTTAVIEKLPVMPSSSSVLPTPSSSYTWVSKSSTTTTTGTPDAFLSNTTSP
ncbi:unnamed protein product [Absidia cylindrospora]